MGVNMQLINNVYTIVTLIENIVKQDNTAKLTYGSTLYGFIFLYISTTDFTKCFTYNNTYLRPKDDTNTYIKYFPYFRY